MPLFDSWPIFKHKTQEKFKPLAHPPAVPSPEARPILPCDLPVDPLERPQFTPPPEDKTISPFVQGIIYSVDRFPDAWVCDIHRTCYKHVPTELMIFINPNPISGAAEGLTVYEQKVLAVAFKQFDLRARMIQQELEAKKKDQQIKYFTKLAKTSSVAKS